MADVLASEKKKKYKCVTCHCPLRHFSEKYFDKPDDIFRCHICGTRQKYGKTSDSDIYFTEVEDEEDEEEEEEEQKDEKKGLHQLVKGDQVKVKETRRGKHFKTAWIISITPMQSSGRTRAGSRANYSVKVVFDVISCKVFTFDTKRSEIVPGDGPNFDEQQYLQGEYRVKAKLASLSEAQRLRCDDLVHGGHPQYDILITKFNTAVTYRDVCTLRPAVWLNGDIINFYLQVSLIHSMVICSSFTPPQILLIYSSNTPHLFLKYSSFTPHIHTDTLQQPIFQLEFDVRFLNLFCQCRNEPFHLRHKRYVSV